MSKYLAKLKELCLLFLNDQLLVESLKGTKNKRSAIVLKSRIMTNQNVGEKSMRDFLEKNTDYRAVIIDKTKTYIIVKGEMIEFDSIEDIKKYKG